MTSMAFGKHRRRDRCDVAKENDKRVPELRRCECGTVPCFLDNAKAVFRNLHGQWGIVVPETRDRAKNPLGPFLYLWLALSILLNISGIGSIVDGLVHWAGFFRDALDIYRVWIREPLLWEVHLVWPSSWPRIPGSVFDLLVVWSAFFLAVNLQTYREDGETIFALSIKDMKEDGVLSTLVVIALCFFAFPVTAIALFFRARSKDDLFSALENVRYFILIVATVIVLAFLNWQFQHIAQ
jgi:hypothetical protein